MQSSQFGDLNKTTDSCKWNQQQQQQQQQCHPVELYNNASSCMYSNNQNQQSAHQFPRESSHFYNTSNYNYNDLSLSAFYEQALISQYGYGESKQLTILTESCMQQQKASADALNNSEVTLNTSYPCLSNIPSPWDWLSQVPWICPPSDGDSFSLPSSSNSVNEATIDSTYPSTPPDNSSQQTIASSQISEDSFSCTPSWHSHPVPSVMRDTAFIESDLVAYLTKRKIRRCYLGCKCFVCSVPGGNISVRHAEFLEHVCHFPDCGKTYRRIRNLKNHLRLYHQVDCIICDVCEKIFTRYNDLSRHMKMHAKEKNLSKFTDKYHLKHHDDKMHNGFGWNDGMNGTVNLLG